MNITTVGIDLAKIVFGVRGVDAHGKVARERDVSHGKLLECFANLPSSVVAWRPAAGFTIRSGSFAPGSAAGFAIFYEEAKLYAVRPFAWPP